MGFSSKTFFCVSNIVTSISILYATLSHRHQFFFFCIFYFSSSKCLQFPLTTLFEETNELSDANSKRRRRYMMMMNLRPGFFA